MAVDQNLAPIKYLKNIELDLLLVSLLVLLFSGGMIFAIMLMLMLMLMLKYLKLGLYLNDE